MSTSPNLTVLYGSANMVSGDGLTTGGAPSLSTRIGFSDVSTTASGAWTSSSSSDTTGITGTIIGRDGTGAVQTQAVVLSGTTPVSGSQAWQRLLQGNVSGTAVGDVAFLQITAIITGTAQAAANTSGIVAPQITLQSGQGASGAVENIILMTNNSPAGVQFQLRRIIAVSGDVVSVNRDWGTVPTSASTYALYNGMLFEVSPNQVNHIQRVFDNCAADIVGGSSRTFYAKSFVVNNSTATALLAAGVTINSTTPALPANATWQLGLASGYDDSQTIANRQTAPANITFTTGGLPVASGVPGSGTGNLPPGTAPNTAGAVAVWFALTLPAGAQPFDGFASVTTSGTST